MGLLLLALGLRLPNFTESVWLDELFTSNLMVGEFAVLLKTLYGDVHPPAYFIFMHFWNGVFGDSEVALRLPPLLCGLATIWLTYRLGELFVGRTAGLCAAFLMCVSPVHIWYSQEARPYSTNLFLLLLAVLAFYRLLQGRTQRRWLILYFLSLGGVVFIHYYMVAYLFAFGALALFSSSANRRRILWSSAVLLLMLAVYAGIRLFFTEVLTNMYYLRAFGPKEAWMLFFNWFLCGNALTPLGSEPVRAASIFRIVLQGVALLVFLRGAWRLATVPRPAGDPPGVQLLLLLAALPIFLMALPVIGLDQTYIERSALPVLPFFVLTMSAGLTGWQRQWMAGTAAGCTLAASVVILVAFFHYRDHWTVYKPNPDWRAGARYLGTEIDAARWIRTVYASYPSPRALSYYDVRIQEAKNFERDDKIERLLAATQRVFGTGGFGEAVSSFVREQYASVERWHARNRERMRMIVFELRDRDPQGWQGEGGEQEIFYMVCHPWDANSHPKVKAILQDPRYRVVNTVHLRRLTLYKLQRVG